MEEFLTKINEGNIVFPEFSGLKTIWEEIKNKWERSIIKNVPFKL